GEPCAAGRCAPGAQAMTQTNLKGAASGQAALGRDNTVDPAPGTPERQAPLLRPTSPLAPGAGSLSRLIAEAIAHLDNGNAEAARNTLLSARDEARSRELFVALAVEDIDDARRDGLPPDIAADCFRRRLLKFL